MSNALFIVLEREVSGIDASSVDGKFWSRNLDWLNEVAGKLNVRALSTLISVNPQDAATFFESEGGDPADLPFRAEEWFDASEGLRTIDALLDHTKSSKPDDQHLLRDLIDCKRLLDRARRENVRFHFAVDF